MLIVTKILSFSENAPRASETAIPTSFTDTKNVRLKGEKIVSWSPTVALRSRAALSFTIASVSLRLDWITESSLA